MRILFSPIGGTDPISANNFRDGAMLHICRWYKPDLAVLYFSKEMYELEEHDQRYTKCIKWLSEKIKHKIEIKKIYKKDLVNVQKFDDFITEFKDIITDLVNSNPEAEFYLNISSGTPAMKSSLQLISVMTDHNLTAIQVITPDGKSNVHFGCKKDYGVEELWELNEDNDLNSTNRCEISAAKNWLAEITKERIIAQVKNYDYHVALLSAESIENHLPKEIFPLLKAADYRLKLDYQNYCKVQKEAAFDFIPIKDSDKRGLYEYVLNLDIKRKKGEYADFIRAITPVLFDLYELLLKKKCDLDINDYMLKITKETDKKEWSVNKIESNTELCNKLNAIYKNRFNGGMISNHNLSSLLLNYPISVDLKQKIEDLQKTERLRNVTAHEIVSVSDEWLKKETGHNAKQIMDLIKKLMGIIFSRSDEVWNSYEEMNDFIIAKLNY